MKNAYPIIALIIASLALTLHFIPNGSESETEPIATEDYLTPKDLNIQKHVFRAKPKADELVYLECEMYYDGNLIRRIVNYIHTDQKIHEEPLLIIDKTFFLTQEAEQQYEDLFENFAPRNELIICSGFIEPTDHLHFESSTVSSSKFHLVAGKYELMRNSNSAEFNYFDMSKHQAEEDGITRKAVTFKFRMNTIPYEKAKKLYPGLNELKPESGWTAQYVEHDKISDERRLEYFRAADRSLKAQIEFTD